MAVWWVFQNKSYERSRDGGYLWAPILDKAGHKKSHWETMAEVRPGDIVFSCRGRRIVATSVARSEAYLADQPNPLDAEFWAGHGRRVDVAYVDLPYAVSIDDLTDLFSLLMGEQGPLASNGRGKQGYLYPVSPSAARELFDLAPENRIPC
jgi:5-methylcytosine-specific restriction protein B